MPRKQFKLNQLKSSAAPFDMENPGFSVGNRSRTIPGNFPRKNWATIMPVPTPIGQNPDMGLVRPPFSRGPGKTNAGFRSKKFPGVK